MKDKAEFILSIRLTEEQLTLLDRYCELEDRTRTNAIRDRIRRAIIEWLLPDLTDVVSDCVDTHVSSLGLVDHDDLMTEIYSVREDAQAGFDSIEGVIR